AGAYLQAVPQPRAQSVLPGAAPEQGASVADADQQVDHPDRPVLWVFLRAALLQRLPQFLWRHAARRSQSAPEQQPLRAQHHTGRAWLNAGGFPGRVGQNFSATLRPEAELRLNCAFATLSVALTKTRGKPGVAL